MRHLTFVLSLLLAATVLTGVPAAQAVPTLTNEQTPCDSRVLMAEHEASAEFNDYNGDRLECWPHPGSGEVAGDNAPRLNSPPAGPDSRKFYSFGTLYGRPTSVSFVDPATHTFGGQMEGQEDDPDFVGCQGMCPETLSYDANDYFYLDTGSGSTKVSMAYFESHILGLTEFSIVYSRLADESSVFSFQAPAPPTPPVVAGPALPTRPRHLSARPGNHKAFLRWSAPLTGLPVDAYQVRRKHRTYLVAGSALSLTVRALRNHRRYGFALRAHNGAGWGPWSAVVRVRPHR
ncbi:MAG TPA: fibronectin type III domain-containing protein [Marmoricola sp.]|nr:fibronectin type III domain-containing protein [Marmoricola sp.]